MKKCPFCAEDIQEAAFFCKHCGRKVKKSRYHIIIFALIITSLVIFISAKRIEVSRACREIKVSVREFCVGCRVFYDTVRHLPENMKLMAERNEQISSMMNDISARRVQDTESPDEK